MCIRDRYWASRRAARALVDKLAQVTAENAGHSGDPIPPQLHQAIELSHVTFGYEPDKPILKDLSVRFEAGKRYALVGTSGAGKSTLLNLLMGASRDYQGSITIDGAEMRNIDPDSLYDLMSLIGQNVFLFDDTIRSNITMFGDFDPQRVDAAAEPVSYTHLAKHFLAVCSTTGQVQNTGIHTGKTGQHHAEHDALCQKAAKPGGLPKNKFGYKIKPGAEDHGAAVSDFVGNDAPRHLQKNTQSQRNALDDRDLEYRDALGLPVQGGDGAVKYLSLIHIYP